MRKKHLARLSGLKLVGCIGLFGLQPSRRIAICCSRISAFFIRIILISLVVAMLTLVNFLGVKQSTILTNVFTVGKLVPLLIFVAVGVFFIQPANFSFEVVPEYATFSSAVLLLIYAFVGFEAAVIPGGEIKDPQKNIPFALLTALAIVAVLFILIQIVSIGTLPELAKSERPLADAASNFLGVYGAAFITIGALISIFGNLNVGFLSASRMPFAMAEQNELPQVLATTHKKFKTPYISLLLTALCVLVFTIQSSFVSALTISTIVRLLVYATTCAALPVLRGREDVAKAQFTAPFGIIAAVLSLLLTVWLLTNVDFGKEGLTVVLAMIVGLILFGSYRIFRKKLEIGRSVE
jgi:basic amino acid/polyamine antiporter, APA family